MTLIVYDHTRQAVLADSAHSWDCGHQQLGTKVTKLTPACVGACAGGVGGDLAMIKAAHALDACQEAQVLELSETEAGMCDNVEAFIKHLPSGGIFYLTVRGKGVLVVPAGPVTYAIGSGTSLFRALLSAELDANPHYLSEPTSVLELAERVCRMVPTCSGPIEQF